MRRTFRHLSVFAITAPLLLAFLSPSRTPVAPPSPARTARPHPTQSTGVLIAAAADLKFAMDSVVALFSRQNPNITVKVVYGSSGNFFQQIDNSAPFDLFFSADIDYPRQLQQKNKTISDVKLYGTGQLVLWSKTLDPNQEKMNSLLSSNIKKIAIANPAHAPYGKRAEESLRYYQLYDKIKDKLVIGENIAQTAQYAQSGAADIGIIALSLALSPTMQQTGGKYWLIPASSHQALQQGYVLLPHAKGNTDAEKFATFFSSPSTATVLQKFGFGL